MKNYHRKYDKKIIFVDKLSKDSKYLVKNEDKTFVIFLIDGQDYTGSLDFIIKEKEAKVLILGIVLGFNKQKIELRSLQDHQSAGGKSSLFIKSVLFDEAKFSLKGLVRIGKKAQRSGAYLGNQNLLLSDKAHVISQPQLEISADDVSCGHGVTIGNVDKNKLFYLQSRGLSEKEATKLLLNGFFNDVLQKIPEEKLKMELGRKLETEIERLC